jgi:hypothetical protein
MRIVMFAIVLLSANVPIALAQSWNGSYYCVTEVGSGFLYDTTAKQWKGVGFDRSTSDEKFVLQLKYKDRRKKQPWDSFGDNAIDDYFATIKSAPGNKADCLHIGETGLVVGVSSNGSVEECSVTR